MPQNDMDPGRRLLGITRVNKMAVTYVRSLAAELVNQLVFEGFTPSQAS